MNIKKKAVFSSDGEYFAFVNNKGILKIWESAKNTLKQHSILKSTVRFSCSSITWGPYIAEFNITDKTDDPDNGTEHSDCQLLVVGTKKGEILLYDFIVGKFYNHFIRAHTDVVTDLCWHAETKCLYSCSRDKSISVWDVVAGKIKLKWETEAPLQSICVIDDENLLSASTYVTWWNVKDQTIIKKFNDLDSEVLALLPVISTDATSHSYFLTVVDNEFKISAWHLTAKNNKNAVASFELAEGIESIDVTRKFSKSDPMLLSAVLKSGKMLLYQHVLNGRIRKNLPPLMQVQIMSKPSSGNQQSSISIVASKFIDSTSCVIAYGDLESPTFEKIQTTDCPKVLTLTREVELEQTVQNQDLDKKLHNNSEEFSAPNGQLPVVNSFHESPKRSRLDDQSKHLSSPVKERAQEFVEVVSPLHKKPPNCSPTAKKKSRKTESLSTLESSELPTVDISLTDPRSVVDCMIRGLETQDNSLLNMVLQCDDEQLIRNSAREVPKQKLKYVLLELHKRLSSEIGRHNSRVWLKELLQVHIRYINRNKDLELSNVIHRFKEHFDRQKVSETIARMSALKGLLSIQRIEDISSDDSDCNDTDQRMET